MAVAVYVAIIVLIRLSGKRTLAKMNAFDLVVTVALGSSLATVALSKSTKLVEGVLGIAVLLGLQYVVAWLSIRSKKVRQLVKAEPQMLLHNGQFLERALRKERVTHDEVRAAVRQQGVLALDQVAAVVLETDGSMSVIQHSDQSQSASALEDVQGQVGKEQS
ncbi:DUF421 domain-containing protein [Hymenobacter citatus]|nr:YetF domain-containing protein [Hymenobacter citatus]